MKKRILARVFCIVLLVQAFAYTAQGTNIENIDLSNMRMIDNYDIESDTELENDYENNDDYVILADVEPEILAGDFVRLTDITVDYDNTYVKSSGYGLRINMNNKLSKISLIVDGQRRTFEYGISAWATSQVYYDISQYAEHFDYLTTYVGIDYNNQDTYYNTGANIYIYTSADGENWDLHYEKIAKYGWNEADFVKIPLEGVKYIKMYADENGRNHATHWYDDVCYADIMLIKEGYEEPLAYNTGFPTEAELDAKIKASTNTKSEEYQLLTMQRYLVNETGYNDLYRFLSLDSRFKEAFDWLFYSYENMRDYMLGGDPDGTYIDALLVWRELYHAYGNDLYATGSDQHTEFSDLYRRMMYSISLTHSTRVGHWLYDFWFAGPDDPNSSNALTRYQIFKDMYHGGLLDNNIFPYLEIEEMRFVMNNIIDDESILWQNDFITTKASEGISKYHHVGYITGYNYWQDMYYSEENYDSWNEKYDFEKYGMTYDRRHIKNWVVYEEGGVCGAISKTGSNHEGVFGIPSSVVSQPGHAAYVVYSVENNEPGGNARWSVLNNISGWQQSGRTEKLTNRMPNGWGIGSYANTYPASYIFLAQDALNDYDAYEKSELVLFQTESFANDEEKLEVIYREALTHYDKNFDAWLGLTYLYANSETKTEDDIMTLINEIGSTMKYFPIPCQDMLKILEEKIYSPDKKIIYTFLVDGWLKDASSATSDESIQANEVKQIANYLQGNMDNEIATFSFSGENANTIMLAEKFLGTQVNWDFSLDCGETWTQVEGDRIVLTDEEINKISPENGIRVHLIGLNYSNENIVVIDITQGQIDSKIYANDQENKIIGDTTFLQWRMNENDKWVDFNEETPELSGDCTVEVRSVPYETNIYSEPKYFDFTTNPLEDETRKYISIDDYEMIDFSTEQASSGEYASNIVDANMNTMWHSQYSGGDSEKFITVKLDRPVYLSALDYQPRTSGTNGRVATAEIYVSTDGENFTLAKREEGWGNNATLKTIEFDEPVLTSYIKFHAPETHGSDFISGIMLRFYEDTTYQTIPTAEIGYAKVGTEQVVASIVNESEEIIVLNNDGSKTYTFTENGSFTFEFESLFGVKNTVTATVDSLGQTSGGTGNTGGSSSEDGTTGNTGTTEDLNSTESNTSVNFNDIKNHWAETSIKKLADLGLVKGVSDVSFNPNGTLSQGMFITIIARLEGFDGKATNSFEENIAWAKETGILNYLPSVSSGEDITREEIAVIMYNYLRSLGYNQINNNLAKTFTDSRDISYWAYTSMQAMNNLGVYQGYLDNTVKPQKTATRAEMCIIVNKIIDLIEKDLV